MSSRRTVRVFVRMRQVILAIVRMRTCSYKYCCVQEALLQYRGAYNSYVQTVCTLVLQEIMSISLCPQLSDLDSALDLYHGAMSKEWRFIFTAI